MRRGTRKFTALCLFREVSFEFDTNVGCLPIQWPCAKAPSVSLSLTRSPLWGGDSARCPFNSLSAFATTSSDTPTSAAMAPHIDAIPNAVATTKAALVTNDIAMF